MSFHYGLKQSFPMWLFHRFWLLGLWSASVVAAQAPEEHNNDALKTDKLLELPPQILFTVSAGSSLRPVRNTDLGQDRFAPLFLDLFLGYSFPSHAFWGHGPGVGMSVNLASDGGYTEPVQMGEQVVMMPAYMAYFEVDPALLLTAHAGLPFQALPRNQSWGIETAGGIGYRLRAGAGIIAESSIDLFFGADSTMHLLISLELGLFLNYEVLP